MPYLLLADMVLLLHLAFILFVMFGAVLVWRFPRLVWLHVPAAVWGALIELSGGVCPLTPLENRLLTLGGEAGYRGSFVEHYLVAIIYPPALTRDLQLWLGLGVVIVNLAIYTWLLRKHGRPSRPSR